MSATDRCIAHLASGGLLLTPGLRQARVWRRLHDRAQIVAGREVWPTAHVLPLDAWLATEWQERASGDPALPQPMSPAVLGVLWRDQARASGAELVDPAELGVRARQSWLRLHAYGGRLEDVAHWPQTRDQQAFLGWARSVSGQLRDRNACDPGDLARLTVLHRALPPAGPPILFAGFRRLTPAQRTLVDALSAAGHEVAQLEATGALARTHAQIATDPEQELDALLGWLRARLTADAAGIHVAILPGLAGRRGAVERAFEAALQPDRELPGAAAEGRWFDLAGGDALRSHPVAEAAIVALASALGRVDWSAASGLLRSPYIGSAGSERAARIALDLACRRTASLPHSGLVPWLARSTIAPDFAARLRAAIAALAGPARRGASRWTEAFGACLAAWGWPGDLPIGSTAWQAARRVRELLDGLAALGAVSAPLDAREALDELRELAASPFQPESGEPSVLVLDALDEPGIPCDSLWVAGLTASAWPAPVDVDPLLPIEIQRRLGLPRVTPEDCVADAHAVLAGWQSQASQLVLSWPRRDNDTDANGSPLIPAGLEAPPDAEPFASRAARIHAAARLETLVDDPAPPFAGERALGGARALELQSQCPFRAFAELRLAAAPLEEPVVGVDRRQRGILLHRALQRLWESLGSQQAMLSFDAAARERLVAGAVTSAMAELLPADAGRRSRRLESDWLCAAIGRLLALEAARPEFAVAETEREFEGEIGGLGLRLRVDRVDRVGESLVVLDYKTGRASATRWRGARMDAPQLPLYAVLHGGRPAGIAFASVAGGDAAFVGVASGDGLIPGLKTAQAFELTEDRERGFDWPAVMRHWHAWLTRLAEAHRAGRAQVDPKLGAATCRQCHLDALCRVTGAGEDEESAGEGEHAP